MKRSVVVRIMGPPNRIVVERLVSLAPNVLRMTSRPATRGHLPRIPHTPACLCRSAC